MNATTTGYYSVLRSRTLPLSTSLFFCSALLLSFSSCSLLSSPVLLLSLAPPFLNPSIPGRHLCSLSVPSLPPLYSKRFSILAQVALLVLACSSPSPFVHPPLPPAHYSRHKAQHQHNTTRKKTGPQTLSSLSFLLLTSLLFPSWHTTSNIKTSLFPQPLVSSSAPPLFYTEETGLQHIDFIKTPIPRSICCPRTRHSYE